jgi:pimeloyl-ACP methyl ester carboxylesterase
MKSPAWICLIVLTFSAHSTAQTTQAVPYGANSDVGKFYEINGFRMYTEVYGSGQPLLMIHGNNSSMKTFASNVPYFARRHTVILADSRSQGRSPDPDHPITFEMMADDSAALLDAMQVEKADVIGYSDGGINALLLAIRHPEKVKKIVATGANLAPTADAFKPGLWEHDKATYEAGKNRPHTTEKVKNDWKMFLLDWQEPHITLDMLHKIQCPALIVCGDHDLISISHTVLIYQNIKHANLWVVPNSGHGTLEEHADEFNEQAERFFITPFLDHP